MKNEKMQTAQHHKIFRNQATSIWKSKKGFVFADAVGAVQRTFSWFLTSAPRPLQILIFLLILLFIASLFGFFINITGNFCDTAGNEYRTGTFSLFTNLDLIGDMPNNDDLDKTVLAPEDQEESSSSLLHCSQYWYDVQELLENGTRINITEGYYFHDTGKCTDCNENNIIKVIGKEGISERYCDQPIVRPKDYDDLSLLGKWTCGKRTLGMAGACGIPSGYYWRQSDGKFVCESELCLDDTGEPNSVGKLWNLKLKEVGAKIVQEEDIDRQDYRKMITLDCEAGDVNSKFKFFGIEVFNYKLWVMLILLGALIWGVYKIKHP